jgi:hypothetical protein
MSGRRWITTFRKLPTRRPKRLAAVMSNQGVASISCRKYIQESGLRIQDSGSNARGAGDRIPATRIPGPESRG